METNMSRYHLLPRKIIIKKKNVFNGNGNLYVDQMVELFISGRNLTKYFCLFYLNVDESLVSYTTTAGFEPMSPEVKD